jgi:hypothetical protein
MRRNIGLWLAIAAQAVSAPRLVLAFLDVDSVVIPVAVEVILLALTGLATALVLSGGGAYLAHTLATPTKRGGWWKVLLAGVWFTMLACAVVLIAPLMQSGMAHSSIAMTLHYTVAQWLWSIVAVVAVEVVAAGGMLADALRADTLPRRAQRTSEPATQAPTQAIAPALLDIAPTLPTTYICPVCNRNHMNRYQYAAHVRHCKNAVPEVNV